MWHRARYGLSVEGTAKAFVLSRSTILNWLREIEEGVERLVSTREPMNKLSDLVREVAWRIKREWPAWGTRRIAGILARLGLVGSRTSVQRILRRPRARRKAKAARAPRRGRLVAKRPGHVILIDFTRVRSIFRTVWIGGVVDLFSRKVLALRVFRGAPSAAFACALVREAVGRYGKPTWIVTDHGPEFVARRFTRYLVRRKIRRRFGAVGRKTSGAVIERFWRSMKSEVADGLFAWIPHATAQRKLDLYRRWHGAERPSWGLACRTPDEV